MRDPDSGRRVAVLLLIVAAVLFALLWLAIDSNVFSSAHGAS